MCTGGSQKRIDGPHSVKYSYPQKGAAAWLFPAHFCQSFLMPHSSQGSHPTVPKSVGVPHKWRTYKTDSAIPAVMVFRKSSKSPSENPDEIIIVQPDVN